MTDATQKPVIALSMRVTEAPHYLESRDTISHDWIMRLEAWAMIPVLVPNAIADAAAYLDWLRPDLLVLTGGDDIGKTPERDNAETAMLDHALATNLPVLGICRGMQLINGHLGGGMVAVGGHTATRHSISVATPWRDIYGEGPEVNSYHGLGIATVGLAADLIAVATDAEDYIEAFCHQTNPVAGIMWHPERDAEQDGDRALISALIEDGAFWV